MSKQLRITVPLPPTGSEYLRVFEEFFTAHLPTEFLQSLKQGFQTLVADVDKNIAYLQERLKTETTPYGVHYGLTQIRYQRERIHNFMETSPLPPSLDEIAGAVILDNYFLQGEDGGQVVGAMKEVCIRRYKASFPNADQKSLLMTHELLDVVFDRVNAFYTGNIVSHNYMKRLSEQFDLFVPSVIAKSPVAGLDILMEVDSEPPKMTAEEAKAIEMQYGRHGNMHVDKVTKSKEPSYDQIVANMKIADALRRGV